MAQAFYLVIDGLQFPRNHEGEKQILSRIREFQAFAERCYGNEKSYPTYVATRDWRWSAEGSDTLAKLGGHFLPDSCMRTLKMLATGKMPKHAPYPGSSLENKKDRESHAKFLAKTEKIVISVLCKEKKPLPPLVLYKKLEAMGLREEDARMAVVSLADKYKVMIHTDGCCSLAEYTLGI